MRCSRWDKPGYLYGSGHPPLCSQIQNHLLKLGPGPLRSAVAELIESLRKVDMETSRNDLDLLKDVIHKSHHVSHHGESKSLESTLRRLGLSEAICESREVLEIDKLSKYLDLCNDLIRLSRQPSTRQFCQRMKLKICTSYPGSQPLGVAVECFVHGEVQLILFYERYPTFPPPRAIGSSKSACFLCDLFVKKHGGFGLSYSHMKLYPKWTIPEVPWMDSRQVQAFHGIVQAMDSDMKSLLKKKFYHCNTVMESRAHILQVVQGSEIASSLPSPAPSEARLVGTRIQTPMIDTVVSAPRLTLDQFSSSLYYFQDLPVTVNISPNTVSCTLLAGKVDYIFDLEEIQRGQLLVNEWNERDRDSGHPRVNVRELSVSQECLRTHEQNVTLYVHDAERCGLRVSMTWDTPVM